jgi:3-oxoacyl-[acyl-carrier protein] reductase
MEAEDVFSYDMPRRLVDRVAIITGGGHGIGKACVWRLAKEGARIVIAELDATAASKVATHLMEEGYDAQAVPADVADEASMQRMAKQAIETFGRIDILVNNAAMVITVPISRLPFDEIDPDEWDRVMRVNLKGMWLASRAVVPQMRKQKYGKIINIGSGTAFIGRAERIHYVTSKAGVIGFTRSLARALGKDGITVNCVAPGGTLSEENPDESVIKRRESVVASRAIPRIERPEDIVGAVAFFASPDSDFITGQSLLVNGGDFMH